MAPVAKSKTREARSRNTTPLSTVSTDRPSVSPVVPASMMSYSEILDKYGKAASPPHSDVLRKIYEALENRSETVRSNSAKHDRGMRKTSERKKDEVEKRRVQELAEREEEERKERSKRAKAKKDHTDERPLAVGAHAVARQDGGPTEDKPPDIKTSPDSEQNHDEAMPDQQPNSPSNTSEDSHQPRPAPAIPQFQTFGPDPSTFDDPTIYHIRDYDNNTTEEEKKEIFGVADYPHDDLYELTAGTAPDRDLTNAKPATQVTAQTFAHYLEPYFRPFTEEDTGFLKERGDRAGPLATPRRGPRHYKDIWAEEDSAAFGDGITDTETPMSTNRALGNMDQMNDETAETNDISTGPMLSRLMQSIRTERRAPLSESNSNANINGETSNHVNNDGDSNMENGITTNEDQQSTKPLPPSSFLPESTQQTFKNLQKLPWGEMDDKLKQELRFIGFLSEDADTDYDGYHDDEVAARLRYLQDELQRISVLNGARKARVLELVQESMAQQEFSHIAEDLDNQLNQAYLKRHRNIGKGKNKLKRPGGAGGGSHAVGSGVGKPSIGEPIKALMHRRYEWNTKVGPVVEYGRVSIPKESIFGEDKMGEYLAREREGWTEAQEQG